MKPSIDQSPPTLDYNQIRTDEKAVAYLPAHRIARDQYHAFRANGMEPDEALRETLTLWRELYQEARPVRR